MSQFNTPVLGGPMDGCVWSSEKAPRQDDELTFRRPWDGLEAVYLFQWDYQGRGGRYVFYRSQLPIKQVKR